MTDQLEVLFPSTRVLTINDEQITVGPIKFGQLNKMTKVIQPVFGMLKAQVDLSQGEQQVGAQVIELLFTNCGDAIGELVSIACNKPQIWVDELTSDQVIEIVLAFVEVNRDFFSKKILPLIQKYLPTND